MKKEPDCFLGSPADCIRDARPEKVYSLPGPVSLCIGRDLSINVMLHHPRATSSHSCVDLLTKRAPASNTHLALPSDYNEIPGRVSKSASAATAAVTGLCVSVLPLRPAGAPPRRVRLQPFRCRRSEP